jgi:hypothetical protein
MHYISDRPDQYEANHLYVCGPGNEHCDTVQQYLIPLAGEDVFDLEQNFCHCQCSCSFVIAEMGQSSRAVLPTQFFSTPGSHGVKIVLKENSITI